MLTLNIKENCYLHFTQAPKLNITKIEKKLNLCSFPEIGMMEYQLCVYHCP